MNEPTAANEVLALTEVCRLAGWLCAAAPQATARRTMTDPRAIGATYRIQTNAREEAVGRSETRPCERPVALPLEDGSMPLR
jgi:hypothetical protein